MILVYEHTGRGLLASKARLVQDNFDWLRNAVGGVAAGTLGPLNFREGAGIPESFVDWTSSGSHQHQYSPLANGSIGSAQLNFSDVNGCAFVGTADPKALLVFGKKANVGVVSSTLGLSLRGRITFSEDSYNQTSFLAGTSPVVFLSVYSSVHEAPSAPWPLSAKVVAADSEGFDYVITCFSGTGDANSKDIHLFFLAFGVAPGLVVPPAILLGVEQV